MNLNPLFAAGSPHCAYNGTRECFLGLHILIADLEAVQLELRLANLSLKSGEGLWLKPFRGIPPYSGGPLDLVYLDESHRIIETVESFPTFQVSPSSPRAATVLVLPAHSIYWSQTQPGDQLMLCGADEMQNSLRDLTGTTGQPGMPTREKSPRGNGPGAVKSKESQSASSGGPPPRPDRHRAVGPQRCAPAAELVPTLVVAGPAPRAARTRAWVGSLLLERRCSKTA